MLMKLFGVEFLRILKPGGYFVASFHLDEDVTICEPLTLTEDLIHKNFIDYLENVFMDIKPKGPGNEIYFNFLANGTEEYQSSTRIMWVCGQKPKKD